jgi:hypothetical protein
MAPVPHDLIGQFVLAREPARLPAAWPARRQGDWRLAAHPSLPVATLRDTGGREAGWLLGWAYRPGGEWVDDEAHPPVDFHSPDVAAFEQWLYGHGGRFAAVLLADGLGRLYHDATGSLGVVHAVDEPVVASSPAVLPAAVEADRRDDLAEALGLPAADAWYPFALTPSRRLERLIPNHYLDLDEWGVRRHWPAGDFDKVADVPAAVAEVAALLRGAIHTVARRYPLQMSVTAGRDSRLLLACAGDVLDRAEFFTIRVPHPLAGVDCQVASKIVRRLRLPHRFLPYLPATEAQRAAWRGITGECVGGMAAELAPTFEQMRGDRAYLPGTAGELSRGLHWRRGDTASTALAPADLLVRRDIPAHPEILRRAGHWLEGLPVEDTLTAWGLLYVEQQLGCWSAPMRYGHTRPACMLSPFSHRRILELLMSLPDAYRREGRFERDLIGLQWPELLRFPFNWPMGWRRVAYAIGWRMRKLRRWLRPGRRRA